MYPDPAEPTNPLGEARVPKPLTHAQTRSQAWECRVQWESNDVHVLPTDDLIHHAESPGCFCGPRVERHGSTEQGKLHVHALVIHAAMDGRP